MSRYSYRPVTRREWPDLVRLFSEPGVQHGCWCMYWRLTRSEFYRNYGAGLRRRLQRIVAAGETPGILLYDDGHAVGWCSVAPREEFPTLDRSRTLGRVDAQPIWSIVCFFVTASRRRQGLSRELIRAAVKYARSRGARIVEAYPLIPDVCKDQRWCRYMGMISTFPDLGFKEVARRSGTRAIVRYVVRPGRGRIR